VPAYAFPPHLEQLEVLRVVVRNGFSGELADLFLNAVTDAIPELERQTAPISRPIPGFHH
jgi:glutamate decarboxylase